MGPPPLAAFSLGLKRQQLRFLLGKQLFNRSPLRGIGLRGEQPPVMLDVQASDILWGIQMPLPLRGNIALKGELAVNCGAGKPTGLAGCLPVQRAKLLVD